MLGNLLVVFFDGTLEPVDNSLLRHEHFLTLRRICQLFDQSTSLCMSDWGGFCIFADAVTSLYNTVIRKQSEVRENVPSYVIDIQQE